LWEKQTKNKKGKNIIIILYYHERDYTIFIITRIFDWTLMLILKVYEREEISCTVKE
jgi:hypothetical protein